MWPELPRWQLFRMLLQVLMCVYKVINVFRYIHICMFGSTHVFHINVTLEICRCGGPAFGWANSVAAFGRGPVCGRMTLLSCGQSVSFLTLLMCRLRTRSWYVATRSSCALVLSALTHSSLTVVNTHIYSPHIYTCNIRWAGLQTYCQRPRRHRCQIKWHENCRFLTNDCVCNLTLSGTLQYWLRCNCKT